LPEEVSYYALQTAKIAPGFLHNPLRPVNPQRESMQRGEIVRSSHHIRPSLMIVIADQASTIC
jgi:hypothetical protein